MKIRRLRSPLRSPRRELTSQEYQLWAEVTKQVTRSKIAPRDLQGTPILEDRAQPVVAAPKLPLVDPPVYRPWTHSNPGASIDRKTLRKLRRGDRRYDQTLDLHGMTQRQAHDRLRDFLIRAQTEGAQLVLVITGRGERAPLQNAESERGVLRRQVPEWLRSFRGLVSGFEEAPPRLGGGGALFVRIRRLVIS